MSHKRYSDERGIAHILIIVIIVVVVAAIGYAGWRVASSKKNSTGSNTAASTSAPPANAKSAASASQNVCLSKYHDTDLCKFVAAEAAAPFEKTPLKVTMTGSSSGQSGTWILEQDGKGNDSLSMNGNGQTINTITLNGQVYTQTAAGGPWVTYGTAGAGNSTSQSTPDSSLTDFISSLSTTKYTKLGKEACGSLTCFKYQITDSTVPNATQYVWFDTSRYLMRQYYEANLSSSGDKLTMTISYQKITISKPSPVQDLSATTGQ